MELTVNGRVRHWWAFLLRGVLFILLGIYMVSSPASSFAALGFLFSFIILITGIFELLRVIIDREHTARAWHLLLGVIDVILGIILIGHLAASEAILSVVVGLWFLFGGVSMMSVLRLVRSAWMLAIGGMLISLFGILIIFHPVFGAVAIVLWTAYAFIIYGIFNILLGYRLK